MSRVKDGRKKKEPTMYRTWAGMKTRCYDKNNKAYKNYGARGIKVCDRWLGSEGFWNFVKDMGPRPEGRTPNGRPQYSLDRIDHDGDYCPENCKWATWEEQENNRRFNVVYTHNGKTMTMAQWSRELGIPRATLDERKARGIQPPELFALPNPKYSSYYRTKTILPASA